MEGLLILVSCLILGEAIALTSENLLSPAITGLFFLLLILSLRSTMRHFKTTPIPESLYWVDTHLLPHFTFFLFPIVTGAWFFWFNHTQNLFAIILTLFFSTLTALTVIGHFIQFLLKKQKNH